MPDDLKPNPAGSSGSKWSWDRLPTWAKWTTGVIGVLIILSLGAAIGGSGSKEGAVEGELSALGEEQAAERTKTKAKVRTAEDAQTRAENEAKSIEGREDEIIEAGEAKAQKIVGAARSESGALAEEIRQEQGQLESVKGEVSSVEGTLSNLRGEVGGAPATPPPSADPKSSSSPSRETAVKLATIEAEAPPDESLVNQFDAALTALQPACRNKPIELSDDAVTANRLLAEAGIQESYLSILQSVRGSIPKGTPKLDCAEIFAGYVTLRKEE